jgi:peroxiredoxin
MAIEVGRPAPDFTLPDQDGNEITLSELRGTPVVLVFYPMDFSLVCTDQLSVYQEVLPDFEERGAKVYGISVDHVFAHQAFREKLGLTIPLLADFEPKGEVARAYDMYIDSRGHNHRGFVVIDAEGKVKHWHREKTPLDIPGANLIFDALDAA